MQKNKNKKIKKGEIKIAFLLKCESGQHEVAILSKRLSVTEGKMSMVQPENVECSVPGTFNDCNTMVSFLLMLMKRIYMVHTDRLELPYTEKKNAYSHLGITVMTSLCASVYSQPARMMDL